MIAQNDIRLIEVLSNLDNIKIYPGIPPENVKIPFGTYQNVLSNRPYGLINSIDKVKSKYFVKIYTKTYSELMDIVTQIEDLLLEDKISLLDIVVLREEDLHVARLSIVIYQ